MPKLDNSQQGELAKFFKDLGFAEPSDAAAVQETDVADDIQKIADFRTPYFI